MIDDQLENDLEHYPDKFTDEFDVSHKRASKLGQGGQGIVLRSQDPDIAIKLVTNDQQELLVDLSKVQAYHRKFKELRRLPLPQDIEVCKPMAKLKNHAGYVMRLLATMKAVDQLWPHPKNIKNIKLKDIPNWLDEIAKSNLKYAQWLTYYMQTGGIKSRLAILSETARIIARLHSNGLVYGDINQENIFYSQDKDLVEVWLIDADNVIFEDRKTKQIVYTPKFGAPELVKQEEGIRFRTDVHAFAVLAYKMLSLSHPFEGQALQDDGGWESSSSDEDHLDADTKVELGLYPFIDHPSDRSNASENSGLPSFLFYTNEIKSIFSKTFVDGLHSPHLRPTMLNWHSVLRRAAQSCLKCSSCDMSYFPLDPREPYACPFCHHQPKHLIKLDKYILNHESKLNPQPLESMQFIFKNQQSYAIPNHLFTDLNALESANYPLEISCKDNSLLIKNNDQLLKLRIAQCHGDRTLFRALEKPIFLDLEKSAVDMWLTPHKKSRYFTKLELIYLDDVRGDGQGREQGDHQ